MPTFYPKALPKLIPPGSNDPGIAPVGFVLHVAVSNADSLFDFFKNHSGGIESHFYVRFDGTVEQYRDCDFEADAQSLGNSWLQGGKRLGFLSVETEGMGPGKWTPEQMDALEALVRWASKKFGFPLTQVQAAQPQSAALGGLGVHNSFDAWNPHHHSCPGPDRTTQFHDEFLPRLKEAPDMQLSDKITIEGDDFTLEQVLRNLILNARKDAARDSTLSSKVDALKIGPVDLDALAEKVADVIAKRLASGA